MSPQVEASTIRAGAFFAESTFVVPDFQRKYSWTTDEQVLDFWRDLSGAIGHGEYFLGLVIVTDDAAEREVVDGQQRLVTLTILANILRLAAARLGRRLVSESLRTDFLYSMDYETEEQAPRIHLTDLADKSDLQLLLTAPSAEGLEFRPDSAIHDAHIFLSKSLELDLSRSENPALRVGQWTEFISKSLTFAVFMHPNRGAAFRVYEVVNTRGKDLTPTELIKSYLIGSSGPGTRDETYRRWRLIESQLEDVSALDQLTTFVRHVVTLERGYVIPRDLYQAVTTAYKGPGGVGLLLDRLERFLPTYVQMIDPTADVESSETLSRAFVLADALSITRFRPIFLAASATVDPDRLVGRLMDLIVPGVITGTFGTGSVEAQFARAARRLHQENGWDAELDRLAGQLRPKRNEFEARLLRGLNKQQALVVRSACLQGTTLPKLEGFAHQVRPRNADGWSGFGADDYREFGSTIGNWVLVRTERRPQGSRTPEAVRDKLLAETVIAERIHGKDIDDWTGDHVRRETEMIARSASELWYAAE